MGDLFIHIGFHKTGTTFLQKYVFPKIDVRFVTGWHGFTPLTNVYTEREKPVLVSDENLSRYKFGDWKNPSMFTIAKRIHKMFPEANIILTLRDKDDWVKSLYNQHQRQGEKKLSFEEWKKQELDKDDLNFKRYVSLLKQSFPRVLVLRYEELKKNPESYVSKICDFIGCEVPEFKNVTENVSFTPQQMKLVEFLDSSVIPDFIADGFKRLFKFGLNRHKKC